MAASGGRVAVPDSAWVGSAAGWGRLQEARERINKNETINLKQWFVFMN